MKPNIAYESINITYVSSINKPYLWINQQTLSMNQSTNLTYESINKPYLWINQQTLPMNQSTNIAYESINKHCLWINQQTLPMNQSTNIAYESIKHYLWINQTLPMNHTAGGSTIMYIILKTMCSTKKNPYLILFFSWRIELTRLNLISILSFLYLVLGRSPVVGSSAIPLVHRLHSWALRPAVAVIFSLAPHATAPATAHSAATATTSFTIVAARTSIIEATRRTIPILKTTGRTVSILKATRRTIPILKTTRWAFSILKTTRWAFSIKSPGWSVIIKPPWTFIIVSEENSDQDC